MKGGVITHGKKEKSCKKKTSCKEAKGYKEATLNFCKRKSPPTCRGLFYFINLGFCPRSNLGPRFDLGFLRNNYFRLNRNGFFSGFK